MIALQADTDRIIKDFFRLTAIDALSLREREMADAIIPLLEELGCTVEEDGAAAEIGGNCGNILARFPGYPPGSEQADSSPILLAAHMDTVTPGLDKEAFLQQDGRITGNGQSVLGADDVAGIVEVLEALRILREQKLPHRPLEILLTVAEENYDQGSKAFDFSRLQAKEAYVLDLAGPVGTAAVKAPSLIWFRIVVHGRSAHAGFSPEQGVHAVRVAAKAISRLPLGRIDEDTTFNIGSVEGGREANIIPDRCELTGELRSYSHSHALEVLRRMEEVFAEEAKEAGATYELTTNIRLTAYHHNEEEEVCRRFARAIAEIGATPKDGDLFLPTFGGSDNHIFAMKGLKGIVLSCGMYQPHSVHEYTTVEDLRQGAELVAALSMV